ncbi:MAG: stage II sporulation protein E [Peptococcaceae bacterium]
MPGKTDVYPYARVKQKRAGEKQRSKPKKRKPVFNRNLFNQLKKPTFLVLAGTGFFLGRAVFLGELVPFAVAFVATATCLFPAYGLVSTIGVIIGLITVIKGFPLVAAGSTVALTELFLKLWVAQIKNPRFMVPGLVLIFTIVIKSSFLAFTNPSLYDFVSLLFEAVFAALLTLVCFTALYPWKKKADFASLSGEELFCLLVVLVGIIAGMGDWQIGLISVKGLLSRLIILIAALIGGVGLGAAAGAALGVMPGLIFSSVPAMVGAYSFAGLLAGLGKSFGKPGVVIGFLLGNIVLQVYIQKATSITALMAECGLAALIFFFLPSLYLTKLKISLVNHFPGVNEEEQAGAKRMVARWLSHCRFTLQEISHCFTQVAVTESLPKQEPALQALFNAVGNKVCSNCNLYLYCWEKEFYRTYQYLLDLFSRAETFGQVTVADFPDKLKNRCTRLKELAITVTCLYETYKLNQYWDKRLIESRKIVETQLKGIAGIIEDLFNELAFQIDNEGKDELQVKQKLKQANIPVHEVKIMQYSPAGPEVLLSRQVCDRKIDCRSQVEPLLTGLLGVSMATGFHYCPWLKGEEEVCCLRLYPGLKYQLKIGLAQIAAGGNIICGDSFTLSQLREGKVALILSDGMGTGTQAALESTAVLSFLKNLLEKGLSQDLAVKAVNSLMLLQSSRETFATIDLMTINLYTGQVDFIKIGAPPSFLLHRKHISVIQANSLPAGVLQDIEVTSVQRKLITGDVLVMLTDGVWDAFNGAGAEKEVLKEVLQKSSHLPPSEAAELIITLAQNKISERKGEADDMAILVASLVSLV